MVALPGIIVDSSTIVLVSQAINPQMISPEFLSNNRIVPKAWKITEKIMVPPLTNLLFDYGFSISAEPGRIKIDESAADNQFKTSYQLPKITKKVVKNVGSIAYKAVGINFQFFYPTNDPKRFIVSRFLSSGKWRKKTHKVTAANVKITFDVPGAALNVSLSPITIKHKQDDTELSVVSADCNFHFKGPHNKAKCEKILGQWGNRQSEITRVIRDIFEN